MTYGEFAKCTLFRRNGAAICSAYDPVSRLQALPTTWPAPPTTSASASPTIRPADQLPDTRNEAYAWPDAVAVNRYYAANGLNQHTQSDSIVPTYNDRGNLTSAGAVS